MLKWLESRAGCKESLVEGAPGYSPKRVGISQRKTNTIDFTYMWNLKTNKKIKQMNKQSRSKLINTESILIVDRWKGHWGGG